jgi:hypothetical protein
MQRVNTVVERNDDDQHGDRVILYVDKEKKKKRKESIAE